MLAYLPYLSLPFGLALAVAAMIGLAAGRKPPPKKGRGKAAVPPPLSLKALAGVGIPIAFLVAWVWQRGWPKEAALADRPAVIACAGLLIGLLIDIAAARWPNRSGRLEALLSLLFGMGGIAFAGHGQNLGLLPLALFAAVWITVLWPPVIAEATQAGSATTAILLSVLGLGLAAVAEAAGVPLATWPGLSLTAACLGFLGLGWSLRLPFSWAAVLGGGGAAAALIEAMALVRPTGILGLALALLCLIPFAGSTARRLSPGNGTATPLIAGGLALIPALLAAVLAGTGWR